jgi:hypothetical protein
MMKDFKYIISLIIVSIIVIGCNSNEDFKQNIENQNSFLGGSIAHDYYNIEESIKYHNFAEYSESILKLQPYFRQLYNLNRMDNLKNKKLLIQFTDSILNFINENQFDKEFPDLIIKNAVEYIENFTMTKYNYDNFSLYRNQLLMLEKLITNSYYQNNCYKPIIDKYEVIISPEKEHIKVGEQFKAKILFTGYSLKVKPSITISEFSNNELINTDTIYYNENKTELEITAKTKGLKKYKLNYYVYTDDFSRVVFTKDFQFEVK